MSIDIGSLKSRFERAVTAAGGAGDTSAVFSDLVARYGEPQRHYHTLAHVSACLKWLDRFSAPAERGHEVELALWFHDAVYEPRARNNEQRSAELATEALTRLGIAPEAVANVAEHIAATEQHRAGTNDAKLVVDLDLSILGAALHDFDRFEAQIRAEYSHVEPEVFRAGRRRVLEDFLSRPRIFEVPAVRALLEPPARSNLERRIRELVAGAD